MIRKLALLATLYATVHFATLAAPAATAMAATWTDIGPPGS